MTDWKREIWRRFRAGLTGALSPNLVEPTVFRSGQDNGLGHYRPTEDELRKSKFLSRLSDNLGSALGNIRKAVASAKPQLQGYDDQDTPIPRGHAYDPRQFVSQYGDYRDRPSGVSHATLRQMSYKWPVTAIIATRANQVGPFGYPQTKPTETGIRIVPKHKSELENPSEATLNRIAELLQFYCFTGPKNGSHKVRDTLPTFLRKLTRDTLTYDQVAVQIVRDRLGRPATFVAMPSESMRIASDEYDEGYFNFDPSIIRYVQVEYEEVIEYFTAEEILWLVRNPRSDLAIGGYGLSELEQLIQTITRILWAEQYNGKFFCFVGLALTSRGFIDVADLASEGKFQVWNGRSWQEAQAFETGKRPLVRTKFWSGIELRTSPEHRFLTIPRDSIDGIEEWVRQSELEKGDYVLMDSTVSDPPEDADALNVGVDYYTQHDNPTQEDFTPSLELIRDPEFWEMIGFAIGDGHWPDVDIRTYPLQIFPHYKNDAHLFDRFLKVCERHNIHAYLGTTSPSVRRSDGGFGYPCISISQVTFLRWLYDIGFRNSSEGKRIPAVVYRQPASVREAILRGLFSADGHTETHVTGYRTPTVHSSDHQLQLDILLCMQSVGVAANLQGKGWSRRGRIIAQDVRAFAARIGYLQDYKREGLVRAEKTANRWDKLHPATSRMVARMLVDTGRVKELSDSERSLIYQARRGACRISRPRAKELLDQFEIEWPRSLHYRHMPVDVLDSEAIEYEHMYDIEVFDDEHIFIANGMAVHNSSGSTIKGIVNIKGTLTRKQLRAFRREWFNLLSGVMNAWRTPILNTEGVEFTPMHSSNRDMEFIEWLHFLVKQASGTFQIDPSEFNFSFGNEGQTMQVFESSNEAKARLSKDRGLTPIIRLFEGALNEIQEEIDPNFRVELAGLDAKTEDQKADLAQKLARTCKTVNEVRWELYQARPIDGGDVILSTEFISHKQQLEAMDTQRDMILFGLADGMEEEEGDQTGSIAGTPGPPKQLESKKTKKSQTAEIDAEQIQVGMQEEFEHTDDPDMALKIALDHLREDPAYYRKLRQVGLIEEEES